MNFETISAADFQARYGPGAPPVVLERGKQTKAVARKDPEAEFLRKVREMATALGWTLQHHEHDSRKSDKGWLDLTLYRPGWMGYEGSVHVTREARMIFAELKVGRREVTPEQEAWLEAHWACGHEAYVWRESDETWAEIERVLR